MLHLLIPDFRFASLTAISPAWLAEHGFTACLVDVDNTLLRRDRDRIPEEHLLWLSALKTRGFGAALVSNNGGGRLETIQRQLAAAGMTIPLLTWAGKPGKKAFYRACALCGVTEPRSILVIGDQLFTDVLGAHRCGLLAVWLPPLPGREFIATRLIRLVERRVTGHLVHTGRMPEIIR